MSEPTAATGDRTLAEVLVAMLARAGVREVFGVAGTTIMPILDALEDEDRIAYVGARYELSAAEMASGYARASARLGVVTTHVGPGVTGCITALAGGARDGVPLLLITGNEESRTLAREPYHDWDLDGAMRPVTRSTGRLTRPDDLPHLLRRALGEATRGVTGPVHIDLPEDLARTRVSAEDQAAWMQQVGPVLDALAAAPAVPVSRPGPSPKELQRTVDLLAEASAPLVVMGEASRWSADRAAVLDRCAGLGVPWATSFGARGEVGDRPSYVGTLGRFGSRDTNALLAEADVVLALGAELTDVDTVGWQAPGPDTRLIMVHPDAGKVDRRLAPTLGVVADVESFLHALAPVWDQRGRDVPAAWARRAAAVDRRNGPVGDPASADDATLDAVAVSRLIAAAPDSWVVSMDPGFGSLSLSAAADFGGTRFMYADGLGAMGFAVPSAIGATRADGVEGALAVIGDGALFMSLSSLESVASLGAPVVVLVVDDGGFGSQRRKQQEGYGRTVGVDYRNPDIAAIAAAMGIEATWLESVADVDALCASLPGRTRGAVAVVRRRRDQQGAWDENGASPR